MGIRALLASDDGKATPRLGARMKGNRLIWRAYKRGFSLYDKLVILLYSAIRFRPGAWYLLAKMVGHGDWCLRLRTPHGVARLVFNPLDPAELVVVDEILFERLYIIRHFADVLVDCGAFRGISTVFMQDQLRAGVVLAFEPETENFAILKQRLQNLLGDVQCKMYAVGNVQREVRFSGKGVGGRVGEEGKRVWQVRLSDTLEIRHAESLMLKMDVEGAEEAILPDLLPHLPSRCTILLETHSTEERAHALLDTYRAAGFKISMVRRHSGSGVVFIDWELQRDGDDGC